MKMPALFKIMVKEFKKDILISFFLFVLVDFIYTHFTGVSLEMGKGMILWQGGNAGDFVSFSTVLLKLVNISIVLITVGKIADKLSSDIIIYLLARMTNYRKFMYAYSVVIMILGEILLTVSHLIYYCFAGFCLEQVTSSLSYLLADILGFLGIMILYIVLNNGYSIENSFVYILAVYLLNTILPVPILPAMSTVRFLILKSQIGIVPILLLNVGIDLLIAIYYDMLIKKRRVNLC